MKIGAHQSIAGGFYKAIERGKSIGCECIQIFTHSPQTWSTIKINDKDAEKFKEASKMLNIYPNVSHASYLINIASSKEYIRKKSIKSLIMELNAAEKLGLYGVVVHPGSNKDKNIDIVIDSINIVLDNTENTKLFIETTAGQGNVLGSKFEEIRDIIDGVYDKNRIGVCFDTCHSFASGYDISNKYDEVFYEFDKIIGLKRLKCFHLNDSAFGLGSKKDRHANIGDGHIGLKGFERLMNDNRFKHLPGYLETPGFFEENIKILKDLIR